jgi:hypothetical protein
VIYGCILFFCGEVFKKNKTNNINIYYNIIINI